MDSLSSLSNWNGGVEIVDYFLTYVGKNPYDLSGVAQHVSPEVIFGR